MLSAGPPAATSRRLHVGYVTMAVGFVFLLDLVEMPAARPQHGFVATLVLALAMAGAEVLRGLLSRPRAGSEPGSEAALRYGFLAETVFFLLAGVAALAADLTLGGGAPAAALLRFQAVLTVGLFAAYDLVLAGSGDAIRKGVSIAPDPSHVRPLNKQLVSAASILALSVLLLFGVTLVRLSQQEVSGPYLPIGESVLVAVLALILILRLVNALAASIQRILGTYASVLHRVQGGDLDVSIPVLSRNELGLLAEQTNQIIEAVRNEARLRRTLERVVSPSILNKLLSTDDRTLKRGQQYDVAILFCDLREFTSFSENASAEDVILFLNDYFSELVELVSAHSGIVNKLMGDAVLAVYGLDATPRPIEDAVATAWAILEGSRSRVEPGGAPLELGIGIHSGTVVAGTIGSEDRYEYTFVGDVVNTASRLDGLSKRLGYRLIVSDEACRSLSDETRSRFTDLGAHRVRGKRDPIRVWGAGSLR